MTSMTLTLPKDELLASLNEHRDEIVKKFTAQNLDPLDSLIAEVKNTGSLKDRLVRWHKKVAKGLADGSITVTPSGGLKNAPPKPSNKNVTATSASAVARNYRSWYGSMTLQDLVEYRDREAERMAEVIRPLTTAITLLEKSVDTQVTIESGDYQRLLSLGANGRY
jgi:hypothetical protein